ncbi:hypothetical protein [Streptomyces sp. NBC_01483]|uniref:hypothetical protein n=1 Tax=Streptomyces sp. NBC_01483 TaxID=2903883 RepID=UPI002E35CAC3|nr:hypothetical protein [Streptomyces sp. NBC_01483]
MKVPHRCPRCTPPAGAGAGAAQVPARGREAEPACIDMWLDALARGHADRAARRPTRRADAAGLITREANVDSAICRAYQHAAGAHHDGQAQKKPPDGIRTEPEDRGLGRSRRSTTRVRRRRPVMPPT